MNRIKQLRIEKGWTQEELGEKLNVKRAAISKYESGRIPLTDDNIKKLVKIFDKSSDYILGLDNNKDTIDEMNALKDVSNVDFIYKEKNLISDLCFFTKNGDTSVDSYFPFKLTFLREKMGLSTQNLAERLKQSYDDFVDIDSEIIEDFEKGLRTPSNIFLERLSKFFNIPFYAVSDSDDLFDIEKQIKKLITLLSRKNNPMKVSNAKLDDEDREYIELCFEKLLTDIKLYVKQKYTFKKYSNPIDEELENYRRELEAEQKEQILSVSEEQSEKKKNA